ncbi:hypothetical protein J4558_25215 [Leptolyngbya sp. 15MV]|nr:hypothetical protein J4558_25215 [Leptolyngbya sp. 15MV]
MSRPFRFVLAAMLVLSACSQEPARSPEPVDEAPIATGPASPARDEPVRDDAVSRYTRFDLAACELLREDREEGASADYRCPGLPGVPLLVQEGDGRFDLDAGIDDGGFQTIMAFNDIAETIEWRTRDGVPFAVIFRYLDRAMMDPGRTVLAVEKIGLPGQPGCRVAQIAGDTPQANERARALADRRVEPFRCGADEMVFIGAAR